jgi:hypothetical protein
MANVFSADTDCKALWLISSTLTADGKGTNTLTNDGVTDDGADFKAGSASGVFASPAYLSIADASLDTGFPLKVGNTNEAMGVGFWVKFTSAPVGTVNIFKKDYYPGKSSLNIYVESSLALMLSFGYNSGADVVGWQPQSGFYLTTGRWYHFEFSYNGLYAVRLRIWDDVAGSYILDKTHILYYDKISITDAALNLGCSSESLLGKMNEVVIFGREVSTDDWDLIRQGYYGINIGYCDFSSPRPIITAIGAGPWSYTDIPIPAATIESTGGIVGNADVSISVPTPIVTANGLTGDAAKVKIYAPAPIINAIGIPLFTGTAVLLSPVAIINAIGPNTGSAQVTVPSAIFQAIGDGIASMDYVSVMNTLNLAVSRYTNYNFNSYCLLGNIYLGADETGIYQLYGDKDNGVDIDMEIEKTGMDFGTALKKRVIDIFLELYSQGDFLFEMITEKGSQIYVENNGSPDLVTHRVKVGKGLTGRYLGFNIKNLRGRDFTLSQVSMLIDILSRRARG